MLVPQVVDELGSLSSSPDAAILFPDRPPIYLLFLGNLFVKTDENDILVRRRGSPSRTSRMVPSAGRSSAPAICQLMTWQFDTVTQRTGSSSTSRPLSQSSSALCLLGGGTLSLDRTAPPCRPPYRQGAVGRHTARQGDVPYPSSVRPSSVETGADSRYGRRTTCRRSGLVAVIAVRPGRKRARESSSGGLSRYRL